LDAFAVWRRSQGLPGVSLAWGPWERASGLTAGLGEQELRRVAVQTRAYLGMSPLSDEQGLGLFDLSMSVDRALLVPARLEMSALRAQAKAGMLPALVRSLVRSGARVPEPVVSGSLRQRLADRPQSEWQEIVLDLVLSHVAAVLGHGSGDAIDPTRPFKELGFDSLSAVELRNRLNGGTQTKLPATLIFDHPTPTALATHLHTQAHGARDSRRDAIVHALTQLETMLATAGDSAGEQTWVRDQWRAFSSRVQTRIDDGRPGAATSRDPELDTAPDLAMLDGATDDEVFELINRRGDDLRYSTAKRGADD
jgi:acyl carrier protein